MQTSYGLDAGKSSLFDQERNGIYAEASPLCPTVWGHFSLGAYQRCFVCDDTKDSKYALPGEQLERNKKEFMRL